MKRSGAGRLQRFLRAWGSATGLLAAQFMVFDGCGARTGLLPGRLERLLDSGLKDSQPPLDAHHDGPGPDAPDQDTGMPEASPDAETDGNPFDVAPDVVADVIQDAPQDAPEDARADAASPCTDASSCPVGFVCKPSSGCVRGVLAVDGTSLYAVELPSGTVTRLAATSVTIIEIAFRSDGALYGTGPSSLYQVDATSGQATLLTSLQIVPVNSLDTSADFSLYGGTFNGNGFSKINPISGVFAPLGILPSHTPRYTSSGDIAIAGTTAFHSITAGGSDPDLLVSFDLSKPAVQIAAIVGSIGFACVEGLAALGVDLFGFTCHGDILQIDRLTGAGALLASSNVLFTGAAAHDH